MSKIGHIAIRSRDSRKAADFFKEAFGLREIGTPSPAVAGAPPPPAIGLTDGHINLTFLTAPAENLGCDENFFGIQHIGFVVDDLQLHAKSLEDLDAPCVVGWDKLPPGAHQEIKFKGPDNVIFDISASPWPGTPRTHQTGTIRSGDVNLFYRHFRSRHSVAHTPIIIFHGANYYDSGDWIEVSSNLANERDVLVWDARGFGQSDWSASKNYSLDAHVDDAIALLDHFNWKKAIVIGHSLGGLYALTFAARMPQRAAGLIWVDCSPAHLAKGLSDRQKTGATQKVYATAADALSDSSRAPCEPGTAAFESFAARLRKVKDGYATRRDPDFANRIPLGDAEWRTRYPVTDIWGELETVEAPVLVVQGLQSDRLDTESVHRLTNIPGVEHVPIDSGHDIPGTAPQALAEAVRKFIGPR